MPEDAKKFYVTTPIYYVNARPHIGHAYTTIVADVLARRHRLLGDDTWFLTGTDEHGQKIERSAAAAGIPPQQFADRVSAEFERLWQRMGITNTQYIRTTDAAHQRGVQKLFATLYERGHIYLSSYTGQYSIGEEMFVDGPPGTIGPDGKPTETVTEENFFFRLSDFQLPLLDLIESDTLRITPEARKNEVLSFLRGKQQYLAEITRVARDKSLFDSNLPEGYRGPIDVPDTSLEEVEAEASLPRSTAGNAYVPGALKDLSISRSSFTWGIPVPEPAASLTKDPHIIYVWLDALANYMTAVGYGDDSSEGRAKFARYWPADLHLVGKEIIRFHCVYWPAFLLALNPAAARKPGAPFIAESHPAMSGIIQPPSEQDSEPGAPRLASDTWAEAPKLTPEDHQAWAEKMLPQAIAAHGWLLFDDAKMSKSKGNIVRTETILEAFGALCPPPPQPTPEFDPNPVPLLSFRSGAKESASLAPQPPTPPPAPLLSFRSDAKESASLAPQPPNPAPTPLLSSRCEAKESASPAAQAPHPAPTPLLSFRSEAEESASSPATSSPAANTPASLKGTASAVPSTQPEQAASAAEAISPSPHQRDLFAADVLRYFLLREIPFGQDGSFTFEALITRYNADLAGGYGNLVSRTLKMIQDWFGSELPSHAEWGKKTFQVATREIAIGRGRIGHPSDSGPFLTTADVELAQIAKLVVHFYPIHFETLNFSAATNFDAQLRGLRTDSKVVGSEQGALDYVLLLIRETDKFLSGMQPWKLIKSSTPSSRDACANVLYIAAESIRIITALLYPILPYATASVWHQLGLGNIEESARKGELKDLTWGGLKPGTKLGPLSPIFPRADKGLAQTMSDIETEKTQQAAQTKLNPPMGTSSAPDSDTPSSDNSSHPGAPPRTGELSEPNPGAQVGGSTAVNPERAPTPTHTQAPASGIFGGQNTQSAQPAESPAPADASPQITIEDFAKVELRVAKVLVCERIPKADKLLRLEVDLGYERRQILSGIAEWYTPEDLIGRRIVVITNLAPRKMRGLESHGMLLAASASEGGKPALATFLDSDDLPLGSRLK